MHKLLDTEALISLEAKAALEEAQSALAAAKAEAAQQLAKLRRELDSRDERIRKLEHQLRGAYGGLSRAAMRASAAAAAGSAKGAGGVRVSRVGLGTSQQSNEDVLAGLGAHENVIELVVAEAVLTVRVGTGSSQLGQCSKLSSQMHALVKDVDQVHRMSTSLCCTCGSAWHTWNTAL